ncbi:hypothetical protein ACJIZ3_013389 [Penstemon smallii]|uniref:Uncharacterized protein n=1 Tax=Penstemon smallii TaxID=265156 RepID=A0ABD3UPP6_9LAMI
MDESWRMRMGMPTPPPPAPPTKLPIYPPRRSTEDHRRKQISDDDPEDFTDVFGGPPRTVLSRQFSACTRSSSSASFFYEEIFRPAEKTAPPVVKRGGRSLPEFMIPGNPKRSENNRDKNGFYSDIFGWDDERVLVRSRSRSKASSSSVLSSEELSPLRPAFSGEENDDVSFFGMKLRPINVKSRWNATRMGDQRQENVGSSKPMIYSSENENYPFGLNRRNASPETISVEPMSNGSFRVSTQPNSSPNSSLCQSPKKTHEEIDEDELDEVMSSYVIEINSDNNKEEGTFESNGVDEAIAWAKQKFQTQELQKPAETEEMVNGSEGHTESFGSLVYNLDEQKDKWASEEDSQQFESKVVQTEMHILDEKIRLWSAGKEDNLRLLLSSLHHIVWPSSGWVAIPLTNVIESSQVKKAYQKARLCLHPDKLQQRGATLPQKYIAEKAFSILQEAWAAFISQDFFCH